MNLREVLQKLDFAEDCDAMTDEQPAYWYDFGNLKLTAAQVTNLRFASVFLFGGAVHDSRSIGDIRFEMPLQVDSFEQGVAWITYGLGKGFRPKCATPWVEQGREWKDTLPWEQEKRQYAARPHCSVDREWFRVATKKLREQASSANSEEVTCFEFDGNVLRIKTQGEFLAMPAEGTAWNKPYFLPTSTLDFLPKRIMHNPVELMVWEGKLSINRRAFHLIDIPSESVEA